MGLKYTIVHNGTTWTSSQDLDTVNLSNGSVTDIITSAGTRVLACSGKIASNNIVIGEKTLNCANKIMTDNITITTEASGDPLYFQAEQANSTISMSFFNEPGQSINLQYSLDQTNWSDFIVNTTIITLDNVGDKVYIKGNNPDGLSDYDGKYYFRMSGLISGHGSIMTLVDGSGFSTSIPNPCCFAWLFNDCTSLTLAPALPAINLTSHCYQGMFNSCTSLQQAPDLLATLIPYYAYASMFQSCIGLTTPGILSAITVQDYGCKNMFGYCDHLITPPQLHITTVGDYGCAYMFQDCEALTTAPILEFETIGNYGCQSMFSFCKSFINAPELMTTSIGQYAYQYMFNGCANLINPPSMLPAQSSQPGMYYGMFQNCVKLISAPKILLNPTNQTYTFYICKCMFKGCSSLVTVPMLNIQYYYPSSFEEMFSGCSSLQVRTSPTSLATKEWYITNKAQQTTSSYTLTNMFYGCQSDEISPTITRYSRNRYYTQNTPI